jgi:tRNA dimethylallyltransferase
MTSSIPTIVGPTGVGKTKLALYLAKNLQAELISADSRQVYIGMDIGTGKEVSAGQWSIINGRKTLLIRQIPIHGLDIVRPNQEFSIADWQTMVIQLIIDIRQRKHQPIIIGGTGFYLDALQGKVDTLSIKPNPALRQKLTNQSPVQLLATLKHLDPHKAESLNNSDQHNPARLIRAIEVHRSGLMVNGQLESQSKLPTIGYPLRLIGLTMPRPLLLQKVDTRIDLMIEQGFIPEVRALVSQYGTTSQALTGIGYREIVALLDQQLSKEQSIQLIKTRTHQYIKRQYTWLNKQSVEWVDVSQPNWQEQAEALAMNN